MIEAYLADHDVVLLALQACAWLGAGAVIGALYFLTLRWNVQAFASRQSLLAPIGIQAARFALLAGMLAVIVIQFGALPLLLAALGILVARTILIRRGIRS